MKSENWDALAFPMKHPDGKNNLHQKREVKLSAQYYFVQRLRNKDRRFRNDPSYIFSAASYIEKQQMQRNINVSFLRGKKSKTSLKEGNVYNFEDGFSVFDNTSNTPTYWKKAKYEMMAKLDNLGPFQFFFTLSCADRLWEENFTAVLEEQNIKIKYNCNSETEGTEVGIEKNGRTVWISFKKYLEDIMDRSLHEVLRRNVVTATRNYNRRLKTFIKEIMTHPSNPMSIVYYSAKLEFQGRGAGHNHGTLWVNMEKMEFMMQSATINPGKYNIESFEKLFVENEKEFKEEVKEAILICMNTEYPKNETETILEFERQKMKKDYNDVLIILSNFKFLDLRKAFKKLYLMKNC